MSVTFFTSQPTQCASEASAWSGLQTLGMKMAKPSSCHFYQKNARIWPYSTMSITMGVSTRTQILKKV